MSAEVVVKLTDKNGLTYMEMDVWDLLNEYAMAGCPCESIPLGKDMKVDVLVKPSPKTNHIIEANRPAYWEDDIDDEEEEVFPFDGMEDQL